MSGNHYGLARHHGIPTRLLDWSEGLLQALFFAFDCWDGYDDGTPCIWMLRPAALNEFLAGVGLSLLTGGALTEPWLPPLKEAGANTNPIAVYPTRSNVRIINQIGAFTVHGTNTDPLDDIAETSGHADLELARIDLKDFDPDDVRRTLYFIGLRQSLMYPDLDHLARDLEYWYPPIA